MRQFEKEGKTMGIIEKSKLRGKAGFSLLELMVVVAILGVLATVAVPRFNIFRTRARQGEAKLNLDVIYKLQEAFKIEHEQYYDGNGTTWGGVDMNTITTRQGHKGGASTGNECGLNKLGFRLADCGAARYGYYIAGAGETTFLGIAYGASDASGDTRVYPGCDGDTSVANTAGPSAPSNAVASTAISVASRANLSAGIQDKCEPQGLAGNLTEFDSGDAWCTDHARNLDNYRDIVEFCNQ